MNINMFDAITAIRKTPDIMPVEVVFSHKRASKAKAVRKRCFDMIKQGERDLSVISKALKVHRSTLLVYLRELRVKGLIDVEIIRTKEAKILSVDLGANYE